jgi:hypothetical protein
MNKKITMVVTVEFEDSIYDDNEVKEVAENVASAIEREAKNYGITPDNSETFVRSISVSNGNIFNIQKKLA